MSRAGDGCPVRLIMASACRADLQRDNLSGRSWLLLGRSRTSADRSTVATCRLANFIRTLATAMANKRGRGQLRADRTAVRSGCRWHGCGAATCSRTTCPDGSAAGVSGRSWHLLGGSTSRARARSVVTCADRCGPCQLPRTVPRAMPSSADRTTATAAAWRLRALLRRAASSADRTTATAAAWRLRALLRRAASRADRTTATAAAWRLRALLRRAASSADRTTATAAAWRLRALLRRPSPGDHVQCVSR